MVSVSVHGCKVITSFFFTASLAIPPHIEGAEVSQLVVSDDSNRATATYSNGATRVFDCGSQPLVWTTPSPNLGCTLKFCMLIYDSLP